MIGWKRNASFESGFRNIGVESEVQNVVDFQIVLFAELLNELFGLIWSNCLGCLLNSNDCPAKSW